MYQRLHPILAEAVAIRPADYADVPALERLAHRETAPAAAIELTDHVRDGGVLVAESGGRVQGALALRDGLAIADPSTRRLLRARAAELARNGRRWRWPRPRFA